MNLKQVNMATVAQRDINRIANAVGNATHEVCTILHQGQCDVVANDYMVPAAKVEVVLQLQALLQAVEHASNRQINRLGPTGTRE